MDLHDGWFEVTGAYKADVLDEYILDEPDEEAIKESYLDKKDFIFEQVDI